MPNIAVTMNQSANLRISTPRRRHRNDRRIMLPVNVASQRLIEPCHLLWSDRRLNPLRDLCLGQIAKRRVGRWIRRPEAHLPIALRVVCPISRYAPPVDQNHHIGKKFVHWFDDEGVEYPIVGDCHVYPLHRYPGAVDAALHLVVGCVVNYHSVYSGKRISLRGRQARHE